MNVIRGAIKKHELAIALERIPSRMEVIEDCFNIIGLTKGDSCAQEDLGGFTAANIAKVVGWIESAMFKVSKGFTPPRRKAGSKTRGNPDVEIASIVGGITLTSGIAPRLRSAVLVLPVSIPDAERAGISLGNIYERVVITMPKRTVIAGNGIANTFNIAVPQDEWEMTSQGVDFIVPHMTAGNEDELAVLSVLTSLIMAKKYSVENPGAHVRLALRLTPRVVSAINMTKLATSRFLLKNAYCLETFLGSPASRTTLWLKTIEGGKSVPSEETASSKFARSLRSWDRLDEIGSSRVEGVEILAVMCLKKFNGILGVHAQFKTLGIF